MPRRRAINLFRKWMFRKAAPSWAGNVVQRFPWNRHVPQTSLLSLFRYRSPYINFQPSYTTQLSGQPTSVSQFYQNMMLSSWMQQQYPWHFTTSAAYADAESYTDDDFYDEAEDDLPSIEDELTEEDEEEEVSKDEVVEDTSAKHEAVEEDQVVHVDPKPSLVNSSSNQSTHTSALASSSTVGQQRRSYSTASTQRRGVMSSGGLHAAKFPSSMYVQSRPITTTHRYSDLDGFTVLRAKNDQRKDESNEDYAIRSQGEFIEDAGEKFGKGTHLLVSLQPTVTSKDAPLKPVIAGHVSGMLISDGKPVSGSVVSKIPSGFQSEKGLHEKQKFYLSQAEDVRHTEWGSDTLYIAIDTELLGGQKFVDQYLANIKAMQERDEDFDLGSAACAQSFQESVTGEKTTTMMSPQTAFVNALETAMEGKPEELAKIKNTLSDSGINLSGFERYEQLDKGKAKVEEEATEESSVSMIGPR